MSNNDKTKQIIDQKLRLEEVALACLQGFIASGQTGNPKEAVRLAFDQAQAFLAEQKLRS